jgi:regulator of sigma E protease
MTGRAVSQFFSHPIPAVVILLGLLVFIHELGHYLVGRWCGIAVETFSIGFGPRILGFRRGGTDYQISWIPLGGFVKFAGAHPSEDVPAGLKGIGFLQASLPKRAATIVAGPAANFLLAVVVYAILVTGGIPHPPALIGEVIEGSAAAKAGLQYGDRIVQIADRKVETWRDIEETISASPGKPLAVTVLRADNQSLKLDLTPEAVNTVDMLGRAATVGRAGVALGRQPAIISVLSSSSPSAAAGLKTGDKVTEVIFAGQSHSVKFYPDLVALLRDAAKSGGASNTTNAVDSVELKVTTAPLPELNEGRPDPKATTEQTLEKSTADVRTLTLSLLAVRGASGSDREFMHLLGLSSSELTVARLVDAGEDTVPLKTGDVLVAWSGSPLRDVYALREKLIANNDSAATFTVLRGDQRLDVRVALKGIEVQKPDGPATLYTLPLLFWGQLLDPEPVIEQYSNPLMAVAFGVRQTASQTRELFTNVASLVTGDIPLKALGGPMLIAKVAGDSARRGWQTFLGSMALISINLGLINLFPIPVLDGGQLVLIGVEGVRRRPLREAAIENFQKIGFALVMALVVLATYNDLSRFWRSMLESVVGIFK